MVSAIFLLFVLGFLVALLAKCRRPGNIPPGPKGMPLIGFLPFLKKYDSKPHKALIKLSKIYGSVTGFYLGPSQFFVSVCGYEAVREALNNDDLNGRPDTAIRRERTFGKRLGLLFIDGEFHREQRRFTLRHLRDLGFGRTSSEDMIHEEIVDLLDAIRGQSNSDPNNIVDFYGMFNLSALNVLWALIGGERFMRDDIRLTRLLQMLDIYARSFKPLLASLPIPRFVLQIFPPIKGFLGLKFEVFQPLQNFIKEVIEEHIKTRQENDIPRDFIDVYLNEMNKQQFENSSTKSNTFDMEQLISTIIDLFIAGSDTTSSSIGYTILFMIHYPDVQRKMQSELDQVCGDALPSLAHRSRLVYTEAVLNETLRLASILPQALMHSALKDTKLCGYNIPKGTILMINIDSINSDETYWTDPHIFRPERHLDAEGLRFKQSERVLPFGAGKRMCLGEPLARNTFYLFTSALIKNFKFDAVPDAPLPTLEPITGVTNQYQRFRAVVTPRI